MEYEMILTTVASEDEARALARSLVEARLAACVQIQPIQSVYRWKGEVLEEPEWRLVVKTVAKRYVEVERHIREQHSYETPQIIRVRIEGGSADYLKWVEESVG
jgi:periplasmic divalent cation tolerance protein